MNKFEYQIIEQWLFNNKKEGLFRITRLNKKELNEFVSFVIDPIADYTKILDDTTQLEEVIGDLLLLRPDYKEWRDYFFNAEGNDLEIHKEIFRTISPYVLYAGLLLAPDLKSNYEKFEVLDKVNEFKQKLVFERLLDVVYDVASYFFDMMLATIIIADKKGWKIRFLNEIKKREMFNSFCASLAHIYCTDQEIKDLLKGNNEVSLNLFVRNLAYAGRDNLIEFKQGLTFNSLRYLYFIKDQIDSKDIFEITNASSDSVLIDKKNIFIDFHSSALWIFFYFLNKFDGSWLTKKCLLAKERAVAKLTKIYLDNKNKINNILQVKDLRLFEKELKELL